MKILITGGAGFIGSQLCEKCTKEGHTVLCLDNVMKENLMNIRLLLDHRNFKLIEGDIRDSDLLGKIMRDIDVVVHLAAQIPEDKNIDNPFLCFDINARGSLNLLNAAYINSVDKFIYASTMSVYSEPPEYLPVDENHPVQPSTIYGVTKLAGELCCNLYSQAMNIVVLRYSGAYGRGERKSKAIATFINQALSNRPITIYGDGTQSTDHVYVKDIVQATLLALEKNKPGTYNIGGGEEISARDLAKRVINFTGSKSEIVMVDKNVDRPFRFVLDITKSRKVLGYSPVSFDEGLSRYIEER
jgi:UDP-glucose 4-epimerase